MVRPGTQSCYSGLSSCSQRQPDWIEWHFGCRRPLRERLRHWHLKNSHDRTWGPANSPTCGLIDQLVPKGPTPPFRSSAEKGRYRILQSRCRCHRHPERPSERHCRNEANVQEESCSRLSFVRERRSALLCRDRECRSRRHHAQSDCFEMVPRGSAAPQTQPSPSRLEKFFRPSFAWACSDAGLLPGRRIACRAPEEIRRRNRYQVTRWCLDRIHHVARRQSRPYRFELPFERGPSFGEIEMTGTAGRC